MKTFIASRFLALVLLSFALSLFAADKEKGSHKKNASDSAAGEQPPAHSGDHKNGAPSRTDAEISASEREIIRAFVDQRSEKPGQKAHRLPPGLAKKVARNGKLPPGWEKKLRPGELLSPVVWSESHPLPKEITIKLPPPPAGTILIAVEGKVARVLEKTREILDVFDVLP